MKHITLILLGMQLLLHLCIFISSSIYHHSYIYLSSFRCLKPLVCDEGPLPQELWALSRNDEKDQIVLLRRSCARCEPGHMIMVPRCSTGECMVMSKERQTKGEFDWNCVVGFSTLFIDLGGHYFVIVLGLSPT